MGNLTKGMVGAVLLGAVLLCPQDSLGTRLALAPDYVVHTGVVPPEEQAQLKQEAIERFRREAPMGFKVISESIHVSVHDGLVRVHYRVSLDNGDLIYVSVVFKREGTQWRYSHLGTLCCGEH
jgi:hypothetical protein